MIYTRRGKRNLCQVAITSALCLAGCQWGPGLLRVGHTQYGQAVRQVKDEQLLLNLVRLRYTDLPVFLQITSISSQFVFDQSASVSGTLVENVGPGDGKSPGVFNLSADVGYEERPTVTYGVPDGAEFLQGLLTPIKVDQLALIAESGWSGGQVMRLAVERMNALSNAPTASGPTPAHKPTYEGFLEAVALLGNLSRKGLVGFEYEEREEAVSDPIPASAVQTMGMAAVMQLGVEFHQADEGRYVLTRKRRVLSMRFAHHAASSPDAARLRELLRLDPMHSRFDLVEYDDSLTDDLEPNAKWADLALNTRSVLGILYYLSNAVQVPEEHLAAGIAPETVDEDGEPFDWSVLIGDLITIHSGKEQPRNAAVRVKYRGYWYFVRSDDHVSKSTFTLMQALSSLVSVPVETTKPVLTLPVGS